MKGLVRYAKEAGLYAVKQEVTKAFKVEECYQSL